MVQNPSDEKARATRGLFRLWRRNRFLVIAFVVALLFSVFFAARTVLFLAYWTDHRDQPLEPWMTVGYVAHSWHVDRDIILDAVGMAGEEPARRPLGRIALDRGVTFDALASDVMDAIGRERMQSPDAGPRP